MSASRTDVLTVREADICNHRYPLSDWTLWRQLLWSGREAANRKYHLSGNLLYQQLYQKWDFLCSCLSSDGSLSLAEKNQTAHWGGVYSGAACNALRE